MKYFHGKAVEKNYFEGWYFKHRINDTAFNIIVAYHINTNGEKKASIQVITNEQSFTVWYPGSEFYAAEDRLFIRIGNNVFYEQGCRLDIHRHIDDRLAGSSTISLEGNIQYGSFHPLAYDIMGPFHLLPKMQCSHGILSMHHKLAGSLLLNGQPLNFRGGTGYIESDRGSAFPDRYFWLHCEEMDTLPFSITLAIADIPLGTAGFTGCICAISYRRSQYRLATYRNVKIHQHTDHTIWLSQGKYTLLVQLNKNQPQKAYPLRAPVSGSMTRIIQECPLGKARFRFWENKTMLFDIASSHVSMESSKRDRAI